MNSILQCLSNTTPLAKYFIDSTYQKHVNRTKDNVAIVAEEVAQVIKALWRGIFKSLSPRDLKYVLGRYKDQFGSLEQQDCHEFLMYLFEKVHNDLKQSIERMSDGELTDAQKAWDTCLKGHESVISKLFYGQFRSTVTCALCHETSTTYEIFNTLTLTLPSNNCSLDVSINSNHYITMY